MGIVSHRFLSVIAWVTGRVVTAAGSALTMAIVFGGLGLVLTLGSLALLLDLIGHMQAAGEVPISVRGIVLVANAGFTTSIVVIGLIGIAGASCQYLGERMGLRTSRCFLADIRWRIVQACHRSSSDPILAESKSPTIASVIQVVSRESALAVVQVTRLPVALTTALGCVAFMLLWAPSATVVVTVAAPIYILILGRLNRHAARIHIENTTLGDEVRSDLAAAIGQAELSNVATPNTSSPHDTASTTRTGAIIFERISVIRQVAFLNSLTLTALIVIVLALVRSGAFGPGLDWGTLIVFIVLLRFAAGAMEQIAVATNVISRFLPSLEMARSLEQCPLESDQSSRNDDVGPARVLAVLSNRPNRLNTLRGAAMLADREPRTAPGILGIRLEDHDGPQLHEPSVAHDAKVLITEGTAVPNTGVLVISARSVAQIKRLESVGLVPEFTADLRLKPPRVVAWPEVRDDTESQIATRLPSQ